jgi:hypothetical protein
VCLGLQFGRMKHPRGNLKAARRLSKNVSRAIERLRHAAIAFSYRRHVAAWRCQPGSSRRAFQARLIGCRPAANGCKRSSTTVFGSSPARRAQLTPKFYPSLIAVRDQGRSIVSPEGLLIWTRPWKTAFANAPMKCGPHMGACTASGAALACG